jgi:ubiquinone/menaquinone biosynthesis C-methylase UbiE
MLAQILPYMRCSRCQGSGMLELSDRLTCSKCGVQFPFHSGILDMLGDDSAEVITPFQRLMQTPLIVSIYERFWRKAGYFLASSRSFGKEMRTVISMGGSQSPARALDLACGTGVFTRPLARATGTPVVGLDLSRPMLLHARRLANREGADNIFFMRASAFSLPFANSAFPYVNCCGALHLFDRPGAALAEIARVLQPGGCLCVQTTIRPNRSAGFAYFLERFIRFGFFNENELRNQLALQGFEVIESERHRISFTFLAKRAEQ